MSVHGAANPLLLHLDWWYLLYGRYILCSSRPQVFCVHSEPNYSLPWQRKRQFSSTGSGFLLPDRRILTNAHCVDHHSQVRPCSMYEFRSNP